eukprot:XP_002518802.2 putative pentatricopeptide repeat-containing protein At2g02150 [Ricinus communis]
MKNLLVAAFSFSFFFRMLFSLRNFLQMGRRFPHRVSPPLSSNPNAHLPFVFSSPSLVPSHGSLSYCPLMLLTGFLCILRFPFITQSSFLGQLDKASIIKIIQQDQWNDPKFVRFIDSSLGPIWVSRVLVELKQDPKLALKFFRWAKTKFGFCLTTESYCLLVHILFYARMYFDANFFLKELISSRRILPGFDVFEVLWSTRNVCVPGFGVFDALFSVFIELGMLEEAGQCFSRMTRFRVFPKARSCNAFLYRLAKTGKGDLSNKFFRDMVGAGIAQSVFTYNIMIGYMCKEGDMVTAKSLFHQMKQMGLTPDIVTYNSLIDGYGKLGLLDESFCLFEEMKDVGCEPDVITYNALINCFCKYEQMPKAFHFLHEMKNSGLKPNVVTYSTLIDALCKEHMLQQAIKFLLDMRRVGLSPNEFTYTSLIDANCKAGYLSDALKLADEMLQVQVGFNVVTYTTLLDGLCKEGRMMEAEDLFRAMIKAGVTPNLKTYTALVHGHIKNKRVENALELLKEIKEKKIKPDLLLYGTIIWGLCSQNKLEECEFVMSEMKACGIRANSVIYTIRMDAYFKTGKTVEALNLLQEMCDLGVEVTIVTFCVLIDGLCKKGLVEEAIDYFARMADFNLQPNNVAVCTALIDGLCKNNYIEAAKKLFDEMQDKNMVPDKIAYTALIDGNLKHKDFQEALNIRSRMSELGMELDLHAYTSLVWGLSQGNLVQQARMFLNEMIGKGIVPDEILCIRLLRKYYELGSIDEAIELHDELLKKGIINGTSNYAIPNALPLDELLEEQNLMPEKILRCRDGDGYDWKETCTMFAWFDTFKSFFEWRMGSRVPVQDYNLRSANSFIGTSLHDLNNTVDSISHDPHHHRHHSNASPVDCMHESYRNSLPLDAVGVDDEEEEAAEEDRSTLDNTASSSSTPFDLLLTVEDVSPIESARSRFLQLIVDHFIIDHVIQVPDNEADYLSHSAQDNKLNKRKSGDVQYEGDPTYALPLMYVANMYESLVNDVNVRLASLNGIRDKTIGLALEAAGGLYRRIAKKFPKKGSCVFKRRELATSLETRTRFPELVIQEVKRVRFVVVNGLDVVEKPNNMSIEDAEWFKRLTGRNEVAVSSRDYKFYSPRHKYRRVASNVPGLPTLPATDSPPSMASAQGFRSPQTEQQPPAKHHVDSMSHQPQFHPIHQNHHQVHQSQHSTQFSQNHQCGTTSHLPEIAHANQSPNISQHMAYLQLQPLTGGHVGGRLHLMPASPAKFCDECGAPYLRETSKFCSECGTKRLGI